MPREKAAPKKKSSTILPLEVFEALEKLAQERRHTISLTIAIVCEDYLREHGYLPKEG
jgi:macrodomain Ter protein organizer (MatP/YcbG family)